MLNREKFFMNLTDQQEMLSGNHREEGRENEGVTVPITANLKETGELSTGSALGRSRESRLSIKTSHFREGATHIGTHCTFIHSTYVLHMQNIMLHNHSYLTSIAFLYAMYYVCIYPYICSSHMWQSRVEIRN